MLRNMNTTAENGDFQHMQLLLQPNHTFENVTIATPSASLSSLAQRELLYKVGLIIHRYWLPFIVIVGLVGNSLSLAVMLKKHNRRVSCCVYMAALAISDNCVLILGAMYWLASDAFPRRVPLWECVAIAYGFQVFSFLGTLIVVSMTIDRFLAIRFPFQSVTWCSSKRARLTVIVIFVILLLYNTPHIIFTKYVGNVCVGLAVKSVFTLTYSWISICFNSIIPFTILLVLNGFIIQAISNRGRLFQEVGNSSQDDRNKNKSTNGLSSAQHSENESKERQLIIQLLLVTFALLILSCPQYIRMVTYVFLSKTSSHEAYATYIFLYHGSQKLYFTNSAINVFLYSLGGSKFRRDLRALFCRPDPTHASQGYATRTSRITSSFSQSANTDQADAQF